MRKIYQKPPKIGLWILKKLLPKEEKQFFIDGIEERYSREVEEKGLILALFWYSKDTLFSIPYLFLDNLTWGIIMIKNYFTTTYRNFKRQKIYTFINLAGLVMGMSVSIVVLLYINYELNFDKFHKNEHQIFRVVVQHSGSFMGTNKWVWTPDLLAPTLKNYFPEIINTARVEDLRDASLSYQDNNYTESRFYLSDPAFLKMFSFHLIQGNPDTALDKPFSLIVTEKMSKKYFGRKNPLGKIIRLNDRHNFEITGILKNLPNNSHLKFDFLGSFSSLNLISGGKYMNNWNSSNYQTYIQLKEGSNPKELESKIPKCLSKHKKGPHSKYLLQSLGKIHLSGTLPGELDKNSETKYIYVFAIIGLLIILITCGNYMNLSTARSVKRVMEVGLRKVIGATRNQIIKQFIGESILFSLMALILSLMLVYLLLPVFSKVLDRDLSFYAIFNIPVFFTLVAVALLIGFLSGCYPAFYISSFQSHRIIKGNYKSGSKGSLLLRNSLVLVQFFITIGLIISSLIIAQQFSYIRNKDIGFSKDQILSIKINRYNTQLKDKIELFKRELLKSPSILAVSKSNWPPTNIRSGDYPTWEGQTKEDRYLFHNLLTDYDFLGLFKIDLIKGRKFTKEYSTDLESSYIVNETAAKIMGCKNPLGKKFGYSYRPGRIIGVVKDFHFVPMNLKILPLAIRLDLKRSNYLYIKVDTNDLNRTITSIGQKWRDFSPGFPLDFTFMDDMFNQIYQEDQRQATMFSCLTLIAIFLAALGLFGLVSFSVEQQTREIGIRKVLGASVNHLINLIIREYLKIIVLASLMVSPVVWYTMNRWISNYAYRIEIKAGVFVLGISLSLLIALTSVIYQAYKAATNNPVTSLKNE
jgi:putative ABC transport system permease protein